MIGLGAPDISLFVVCAAMLVLTTWLVIHGVKDR